MNKTIVLLAILFFGSATFANAATNTVIIYPSSDGINQLYDNENQTVWSLARAYTGTLFKIPDESDTVIKIRSDKNSGRYRIYRGSIVFDTSSIPNDAIVKSASLNLYGIAGDASIVLNGHTRASNSILTKEDWQLSNYGADEFARAYLNDNQYNVLDFNADGINYLNLEGDTVLGFMTDNDFDDIDPGSVGYAKYFASVDASGTSTDPYLEITYTYDDGELETDDSLFTQVVSPNPSVASTTEWANDTYAWGDAYWCGTTIGGCGCAITSLVMMGREAGVLYGVDGSAVNPGNFNTWLQQNDGYDSAGSLFWTKAAEYLGQQVDTRVATSFAVEKFRATKPIELRAAVAADNLRVVGYSGAKYHFFYLSGLTQSGYQIRDPFWYGTQTTNEQKNPTYHRQDYDDQVDRGVIYKVETPAIQTGIIEVTLNSPAELLLVDANGDRTGYAPASGIIEEIPHSGYISDDVIGSRDDGATPPHVTKHLLATEAAGVYELHVLGTGGGAYTLSVLLKDEQGYEHRFTNTGETRLDQDDLFMIDLSTGIVEEVVTEVDRAAFVAAVAAATTGSTDENQRFFERWANKIFDEIDADKPEQAAQHLDVFQVLQQAKDVTSTWLEQVIGKLREQLGS
ncbi:hypothetical protein KC887_08075 [Candidatus Kaiserbacteria bacterium]|nr:hypothetical protein [Candidatus Kaiserbacteria bacterium]